MKILLELEQDEDGWWVVSAAEGQGVLTLMHGFAATVPAALADYAGAIGEYAESVREGVAEQHRADVPIWEALSPLVTERG